jgi:predicted amidohydrolase
VRRTDGRLTVALVSEVFWQPDGVVRLGQRLDEAARRGADLALLPELPLHPWRPATKDAVDEDAELMGGPRTTIQAEAARTARIGLVGGIIHRDESGRRTSRGLVFDSTGEVVSTYEPGTAIARPTDAFGMPLGIQICSDNNRPEGSHLLGALGAEAILNPRASEEKTYQRWKVVFRANALTSAAYVLSVNRPDPEAGVLIGGPSVAVDPSGHTVVETTDRMELVTLDRDVVAQARKDYPGYLPIWARLYGEAWNEVATSAEAVPGEDGPPIR